MAEGQDGSKKINVTVKTPKEKQTIEISEDAEIKDVSILNFFSNAMGAARYCWCVCDICEKPASPPWRLAFRTNHTHSHTTTLRQPSINCTHENV